VFFPLHYRLDQSYEKLHRVKEERNILHTTKRRKANWIGHIISTNCLLKRITEGKTEGGREVTGRRGRRCKQLLNDLKETSGYLKVKVEALDRNVWRTRFGRGCGPVVRWTVEWMNKGVKYGLIQRGKNTDWWSSTRGYWGGYLDEVEAIKRRLEKTAYREAP
jgi:hypothetical protein